MPYKLFKGRLLAEDKHKTKKLGQGIILVTNTTQHILHVGVKVPVLCHFYNGLKPGETIYIRTGDVIARLKVKQTKESWLGVYTKSRAVYANIAFALGVCVVASVAAGGVLLAVANPANAARAFGYSAAGAVGAAAVGAAAQRARTVRPQVETPSKHAVATGRATATRDSIKTGLSPHFDVVEDVDGFLQLEHHFPSGTKY